MRSQPSSVYLCMQSSVLLDQTYKSQWVLQTLACCIVHSKQRAYHQSNRTIWVPVLIYRFCAYKTVCLAPKLQVSMSSQASPVALCIQNSLLSIRMKSLKGSQPSCCGFVLSKHRILPPELTGLYWFQTTPVDLCLQNSVHSTRLTSIYGSQTSSSVIFACKATVTFGPDLQVSMGPSPRLWICACKQHP